MGNSGNPTHLKPLLWPLHTCWKLESNFLPTILILLDVKIKSGSKGFVFNGTNMDISNFIKKPEYAAELDGAQGSDIAPQIIFFLEGEPLIKDVQEMAEDENHVWEKLKEKMVQRWRNVASPQEC
jgi:Fe-S-cluster formation regulator IscX/YfhJ